MKTKNLIFTGIAALIMLLSIDLSYGQQWAFNGTHIYNTNTGNVGISTNTPSTLFHAAKNMGEPTITIQNLGGGGGATYSMIDNVSGANWKFKATSIGGFKIRDHANSLDVFQIEPNSIANALYIKSGGNVGIKTTNPAANLHVAKTNPGYTAVFGDFMSGYNIGTNVTIGDVNANAFLYVGQSYSNKGFVQWDYNATPANAYFGIGTYSGNNSLILQEAGGNVGIHTTTPEATLDVFTNDYNYAQLGDNNFRCNYFYHSEDPADGNNQATVYAYRTCQSPNAGNSYAISGTNNAITGYNYDGNAYSFGTSGYAYLTYLRTGGVLGSSAGGTWWGALGYRDSGGGYNGGYFTSYASGSGKSGPQSAHAARGIGVWGDLFGADIHGVIYGIYAEGQHYALYSHGTTYKDDLDVHLQEKNGVNTVMYTHVSTDATIQTCGTATLSSGRASILFDPAFASVVSSEAPVIVTVSPIGESNGVHLAEVTSTGFTVVENQSGKSNVTVNYIAVGKRAGYEQPQLAKEVIDAGYVNKLSRGLHNDNDIETDGEGLYYENGDLLVGSYTITEPKPLIPVEKSIPVQERVTESGVGVGGE